MTWQDHVSSVVNKVNQRLGVLRRVKQMLPLQSHLTLYYSLILPLFDYGDIVWGNKNNSTLMENLQILQNKAAKIILDRQPRDSASEALLILLVGSHCISGDVSIVVQRSSSV